MMLGNRHQGEKLLDVTLKKNWVQASSGNEGKRRAPNKCCCLCRIAKQNRTHEASEVRSLLGSSGAALEELQQGGSLWHAVVKALQGKLEAGQEAAERKEEED